MKRKTMMVSLIRCGQTVWDADGRLRGSTDLPLSDAGRVAVQADLSQSALGRPSLIHHPPDDAATETARLCAARMGAKIKSADGLADPNLGLLEGLTRQEFAERFHTRFKQWDEDPLSLSPPEGEDVVDAADRLFNTVARILKRSRSDEQYPAQAGGQVSLVAGFHYGESRNGACAAEPGRRFRQFS